MPNGGIDMCVTCWFNSENDGNVPSSHEEWSRASVVSCTIRNLEIDFPINTYCVNHPYHNLDGIKAPIGRVYRLDSRERRQVWKQSPDNEEIRAVLLEQLRSMEEAPRIEISSGMWFDDEVIIQVMEFRELRAAPYLRRITHFDPLAKAPSGNPHERRNRVWTVALAIKALASIEGDHALDELEMGVSYGLSDNMPARDALEKQTIWEILKDDPMYPIRYHAILGLKHCHSDRAKSLLRKAMNDPQAEIASLAREVLGEASD